MSDYSWMKRFKVKDPGDQEYIDGMALLYGTSEEYRVDAERARQALALFHKGALMGNPRCVNQMHYCYEGAPGIPYDPIEVRNWMVRYRALRRGESDWLDWDWRRDVELNWRQDPKMQESPLEFWLDRYRP